MKKVTQIFFYLGFLYYIYIIIITIQAMAPTIIFTVIPYFHDGIEVFQNDIKSFTSFADAQNYAWNSIDGKRYDIVENDLTKK